jgi:uncharacterized membrane protein
MIAAMEAPPPTSPRPDFARPPARQGSSAPLVVNICYLLGFLIPPVALAGFILMVLTSTGQPESALIGGAAIGIGLLMLLFLVWMALRCILSLIRASEQAAMPRPGSWLW